MAVKLKEGKEVSQLEQEIRAIVRAGLYRSKREVISEALNLFFALKPDLRLEAAIQLYKDEEVTLARAAEIAGIDPVTFKNVLGTRGIKVIVAELSKKKLERQMESIKRIRNDPS